jgi:transcriptional regulator with XRE-family HTH domain
LDTLERSPASKLRSWRESTGWTLADVAGLTGLDESYIARLESGHRHAPPARKVAIARALGVRVSDIWDPALD